MLIMEEKKSRKYNSEFRKKIKKKISNITNKTEFINIYKIIKSELENKISINRNGIYFNLNILSDKLIENICFILDKSESELQLLLQTQIPIEQNKIKYNIYNKENVIETFIQEHKLTNQEKSLIKKFRQK